MTERLQPLAARLLEDAHLRGKSLEIPSIGVSMPSPLGAKSRRRLAPRFEIGDWVSVSAVVEPNYQGNKRIVTKIPVAAVGQVVGMSRIQTGTYNRGYRSSGLFDCEDDQPSLSVDGSVEVWLVRRGLRNRPIRVLDSDLKATARLGCGLPSVHRIGILDET